MDLTIERDVAIPMRDGTVLRGDVYRSQEGGPFPVLLERTPYGKSWFLGSGMPLDPLRAASAGFAVVVQDTRGRFASEGEFYPFANESQDGFDTVAWCAEQPWSTGRVGMYGSSYMGATQWQAARERPHHLTTIIPNQASSDYYEGRSYMGGCFEIGSLLTTALLALAPGSISRLDVGRNEARALVREVRLLVDDLAGTASTLPLSSLRETALGTATPFFFDWMEHDTYDSYWEALAIEPHYDAIDVPALHLTAWFDSFLKGTLRNFEGMTAAGKNNQRLVVGPWTHHVPMAAVLGSARVGDMNCGLGSMIDFDALQLAWFEGWLRDGESPPGPNVRLFVMGANAWRNYDTWPPPAHERRFYLASRGRANSLTGDGRLVADMFAGTESDAYDYDPGNPVPTLGGNQVMIATAHPPGSYDQRGIESRQDVLVYTSDLLQEDIEVTGWVSLALWVTSSAPDTDFTAKLIDVHPDGRAFNVCEGAQRLALRESFSEVSPYEPGEPVCLTIDLNATAHAFQAGHRIRLDVTSSNFPRLARNLNTGESFWRGEGYEVATQRVLHSDRYPSYLALPVVTGEGA